MYGRCWLSWPQMLVPPSEALREYVLRLPLAKPERGCLDDLCLACGF